MAILSEACAEAKRILAEKRDRLEALAQRLLAHEKLEYADLVGSFGERPVPDRPPTIVATPSA